MVRILIILSVVLSLQVGWSCSQRPSMAGECRQPLQMEGTVEGQIYRLDPEVHENTLSFNFTINVGAKKILLVSDLMQAFLNYETAMTYVMYPKCQKDYHPNNHDMGITFQDENYKTNGTDLGTERAESRVCGIKSIKLPILAFKQVHLSKFRILSEKISEKSTQRMNNFRQECIKNTPTAILVDS